MVYKLIAYVITASKFIFFSLFIYLNVYFMFRMIHSSSLVVFLFIFPFSINGYAYSLYPNSITWFLPILT